MVSISIASCTTAATQRQCGVARGRVLTRTVFPSPSFHHPAHRRQFCDVSLLCTPTEASTDTTQLRELTSADYESYMKEEAGENLIVVDFYTESCGPCKMIYPEIVLMQRQFEDQGVRFVKFNCSQANKELGKKLAIRAVPTFYLYRNGEKIDSMTGAKPDKLRDLIRQHL